jgi:hypothetical protein
MLHYCFFGAGSHYAVPKVQAEAIRGAFAKWKALGIGLEFREVTQLSEAEVRIGYQRTELHRAAATLLSRRERENAADVFVGAR